MYYPRHINYYSKRHDHSDLITGMFATWGKGVGWLNILINIINIQSEQWGLS